MIWVESILVALGVFATLLLWIVWLGRPVAGNVTRRQRCQRCFRTFRRPRRHLCIKRNPDIID